jgi:hypothetical protein
MYPTLLYDDNHFAGAWSGKYHPVAADYNRYIIFDYCCKHKLNTSE